MGTIGKRILTVAIALLLAAGVPYVATTTLHADPGPGSGCKGPCGEKSGCGHECGHPAGCGPGCPRGAGRAVPPCMQDNAAAVPGGMQCRGCGRMHGKPMAGGPPMTDGRTRHIEEMRGTVAKLRALEGKMEASASKDDAAFRAASLEHSKALTDLLESRLKQMEGMTGGK